MPPKLIMKIVRYWTRWNRLLSLRQNAMDPGFHGVPAGPAHPERDGDGNGAGVA
jgi:hypothetical protein